MRGKSLWLLTNSILCPDNKIPKSAADEVRNFRKAHCLNRPDEEGVKRNPLLQRDLEIPSLSFALVVIRGYKGNYRDGIYVMNWAGNIVDEGKGKEVVELDAQTLPNTNSSIEAVLQRIFNKPESCILYLSYLPTDGKERVFLHPDYPKATITFLTQIDWLERPNPVTWHIHIIDTRSALEKLFSWAMSLVAEDWEKKEK